MNKEIDKKRCGANVEKVIIDEFVPGKDLEKEYLEALEIECGELVEMDLLFLDRNGENQEKWHNSEAFKKAVEFEKKYGKSHTYILKSALQRLESIDNANPSEALEGLERIKFHLLERLRIEDNTEDFIKEYEKIFFEPIKQSLLKAQEQDFNYNKIVIPFFDELVKLLGINDTDEMLDKIKEQEKENAELKSRIQDLEKDLEEQQELAKHYLEEQEKVLNIIKEKNVDIELLKRSKDWLDYYTRFKHRTGKDTELTQEEFDLLKRYFK